MKWWIKKIIGLLHTSFYTLRHEGVRSFFKKVAAYRKNGIQREMRRKKNPDSAFFTMRDVLFINGCTLPHPYRYRVLHQMEQLKAEGITCNEVFYEDLSCELVKKYRAFIFFRCPCTEEIEEFITLAKAHNKAVLFDIDDLVIDKKYTDTIPFVQKMPAADRKLYDDGVERMGKTLSLCDAAITTTERLAEELQNYVPEVFINRNTASEAMLSLSEKALETKAAPTGKTVKIGYFSGSITHNADIELILPALVRILREFEFAEFHLAGEADVPEELKEFASRMVFHPFTAWEKLPERIAAVDINIAPLTHSVFNEAKSENKWVEAALVKVPTVASRVGALEKMISAGETGFLCESEEDWYEALKRLILHPEERQRIAENACAVCREKCITTTAAKPLAEYIKSKLAPNVVFLMASLTVCGGVIVAEKHAQMLSEAGCDVTLLCDQSEEENVSLENGELFVVSQRKNDISQHFDKCVATFWITTESWPNIPFIREKLYLVQNYETGFYKEGSSWQDRVEKTYRLGGDVRYITISRWCQNWLREKYQKTAAYAPNGIDSERYAFSARSFNGEKIRILVEGNSADAHKNVDESFKIIERLPEDRFEIWYLSYGSGPKKWYRTDRCFKAVPHGEVPQIYGACDILLKTSLLESFSYPPLEMMSTGGLCVVAANGGNAEYLVNEENCLLYSAGDIDAAVAAVNRLCEDPALRSRLTENGRRCAERRDWENCRSEIVKLYFPREEPCGNQGDGI